MNSATRKPFEDTLAGWSALIVIIAVAVVVCAIRFVVIAKTGVAP